MDKKESFLKKVQKNRHFRKVLVHRFSLCQKIELFIIWVFWANQARRDRFSIFWIIQRFLKKFQKNQNFSRRLVHGFCPKIEYFIIFIFGANQERKDRFFYVLDKKECFLDQKEEVLKNSKNIEIFKGSMVFVKQWNFYHLFFFGKSIQKRVFWDILNKKECFLDKEKEVLQKSKNSIFSMVFVKKLNFLSSVFFGRIKPEKIIFWDSG